MLGQLRWYGVPALAGWMPLGLPARGRLKPGLHACSASLVWSPGFSRLDAAGLPARGRLKPGLHARSASLVWSPGFSRLDAAGPSGAGPAKAGTPCLLSFAGMESRL